MSIIGSASLQSTIMVLLCCTRARKRQWFEPVWEKRARFCFLQTAYISTTWMALVFEANSGAPACLIAFGEANAWRLKIQGLPAI